MTFNVQCLPLIAGVLDGSISIPGALVGLFPSTDDDAIDRARRSAPICWRSRPTNDPT